MSLWKVRYTCLHSGHQRSVKVRAKSLTFAVAKVVSRSRGYYEVSFVNPIETTRVWPK